MTLPATGGGYPPRLRVSEGTFHPRLIVGARYAPTSMLWHPALTTPWSSYRGAHAQKKEGVRAVLRVAAVVGCSHMFWILCSVKAQAVAVCISSSLWAPGVVCSKAVSCAFVVPRRSFVLARTALVRQTRRGSIRNCPGVGALVGVHVCMYDTQGCAQQAWRSLATRCFILSCTPQSQQGGGRCCSGPLAGVVAWEWYGCVL